MNGDKPMETLDITPSVKRIRGRKKGHGTIAAGTVELIVQRRSIGQSITQISRDLGLARNTVRSHLTRDESKRQLDRRRVENLVPLALDAIEKALKAGDARIAMQLIERLGVMERPGTGTMVDTVLTSAIRTYITPSAGNVNANVTPTPDPSSREGGGDCLRLPPPGQIFDILPTQPTDSTGDTDDLDQTGLGGESAPGSAPAGATPTTE